MIFGTIATFLVLQQSQELPKLAEIRTGEVVRFFERSFGRRGTFETVIVLTPTKAFYKSIEKRSMVVLTKSQQMTLAAVLEKEPEGLRAFKRANPMWPSSYDAQDQWITYRVGRTAKHWTNYEFMLPVEKCPFVDFLSEIKTQLGSAL